MGDARPARKLEFQEKIEKDSTIQKMTADDLMTLVINHTTPPP